MRVASFKPPPLNATKKFHVANTSTMGQSSSKATIIALGAAGAAAAGLATYLLLEHFSQPQRARASKGTARAAKRDVYVTLAGGLVASEPALDLALALAVASSRQDVPVPRDVLVLGEVSLLGEIRPVRGMERRLREAERRGAYPRQPRAA